MTLCTDTTEKINQLILELNAVDEFCFDSETTSLNTLDAEIVGLSFAIKSHHGWYVPIPENKTELLYQQSFRANNISVRILHDAKISSRCAIFNFHFN